MNGRKESIFLTKIKEIETQIASMANPEWRQKYQTKVEELKPVIAILAYPGLQDAVPNFSLKAIEADYLEEIDNLATKVNAKHKSTEPTQAQLAKKFSDQLNAIETQRKQSESSEKIILNECRRLQALIKQSDEAGDSEKKLLLQEMETTKGLEQTLQSRKNKLENLNKNADSEKQHYEQYVYKTESEKMKKNHQTKLSILNNDLEQKKKKLEQKIEKEKNKFEEVLRGAEAQKQKTKKEYDELAENFAAEKNSDTTLEKFSLPLPSFEEKCATVGNWLLTTTFYSAAMNAMLGSFTLITTYCTIPKEAFLSDGMLNLAYLEWLSLAPAYSLMGAIMGTCFYVTGNSHPIASIAGVITLLELLEGIHKFSLSTQGLVSLAFSGWLTAMIIHKTCTTSLDSYSQRFFSKPAQTATAQKPKLTPGLS